MPGPLPIADQPRHGIQLLPDHWLNLLLLSGHQEQGVPAEQGQEEGQKKNMRRREEFLKKKSISSEAEKSEPDKEASQGATF